jgi:methyl-accepting chemotaxis protein
MYLGAKMTPIFEERRPMANGDTLMLLVNALYAAAAVGIGWQSGRMAEAATVATLLIGLATLVWAVLRGTLASRLVMAAVAMGLVSLQIHVGAGDSLYHFGVFVTLAILLVYRDWRVPVFAAVLIALHHATFNALQAAGWQIYCFTEPGWGRVAAHATYVVIQTLVEVYIAITLSYEARRDREVQHLLLDAHGKVNLDLQHVVVKTDLAASVLSTLQSMRSAVFRVQASAASIDAAADATGRHTSALAHRITEDRRQLACMAEAVEQLAQAVTHNAVAARRAADLTSTTRGIADRSGNAARQLSGVMNDISGASERIADIIGLIDGIAFQTNILALNAAVEAARAGEQGRGFAVVAAEVRALSQRSARAAQETKALILDARGRVAAGRSMVEETGRTMQDMIGAVGEVAGLAGEISSVCGQQLASLAEVRDAVAAVESSGKFSSETVTLCVQASRDLAADAHSLAAAVDGFQLGGEVTPAIPASREDRGAAVSAGRVAGGPLPLVYA